LLTEISILTANLIISTTVDDYGVSLDIRFGKRKTVNMNEEVARELNQLANSQGKTLYSLVNEIGLCALEANKKGFTLDDAMKAKDIFDRAKKSRMLLVNQDLWYLGSSEAAKSIRNKWLKETYATAQWQANVFLNSGAGGVEFVDSLRTHISDYFWDCSEANLEQQANGNLVIRLVFVPEMPSEHTKVLFKFLEGMLNAHGYVATSSTVEAGFMTATFKRVVPVPAAIPARNVL
jgi:hypothetical protein